MKQGSIILIPFPFAEMKNIKVRPAVVISFTNDKYKDIIVCAVSSVVPPSLTESELLIYSNPSNGLKVNSIIKVDRIVTLKQSDIIQKIR